MTRNSRIDAPHLLIILARCYRAVSQVAERSIAKTGLCLSDFAALEALLHKGPLTITEIQSKVMLATGSMTAAVDRLERKGMLVRKNTPKDRRAKLLELTAEGKRVVETIYRSHAEDLESLMSILNQREKRQLHSLLRKLGLFAANGAADTRAQS
jgi:MarR family 2-MHQ and catechol resistance regulon transcriptional repressor